MENTVHAKQISPLSTLVDQSYLTRLCEEIHSSLEEQREKSIFLFLFRYFKTLLQQERFKEVKLFLDGMEHYSFASYTDRVHAFIGYMRAFLRKNQGKLKESSYWFRQTLGCYMQLQSLGIHNVQVDCYKELGNLEFYQERYRNAIENYQMAINSLSLDEDSEYLLAILMYNLSLCQYYLKDYKQTVEYLDKVIPLAKDTSNSSLLLDTLILKAVILSENFNKYNESNDTLDWAYQVAIRNKHHANINHIWNNWGRNYFYLKRYIFAEQALQHAIKLSEEHGHIIHAQLNLAAIWVIQGRKKEAKQLLEPLRVFLHEHQDREPLLECLELLAEVEDQLILRKKYLQEALYIASERKNFQKSTRLQKKLSKIDQKKKEF